MEENTEVPQKLNMTLAYNTTISLLRIHSRKLKHKLEQTICTLIFTAAMFTIAKRWEQLTDEQTHSMLHRPIREDY